MFLPTILFNSQSWTNLTKGDMEKLSATQMKFLKRILHAVSSTSNIVVLMELGVAPIEQEIHIRQLVFLHHILTRDNEMFIQQGCYKYEKDEEILWDCRDG